MNDVLPDPSATLEAQRVRRRRASDHMWLERGANRNWGWPLVAGGVGALALGLGVFWFLTRSATSPVAWFTANVVLWAVLLVPVLVAFRLSIPRQLFRFRWADVILGVSVGLMVRMLADVLLRSERGFLPWPTLADGTGQLPALWWLDSIVSSALAAPVVEELFFRAFLLVALYAVFCRITGSPAAAGVASALISAALFMLLHVVTSDGGLSTLGAIAMLVMGLAMAGLVLVTGRFWGALIAHLTFSGIWVTLALVGTAVGSVGTSTGLS